MICYWNCEAICRFVKYLNVYTMKVYTRQVLCGNVKTGYFLSIGILLCGNFAFEYLAEQLLINTS